jgi:hypothetical protein
MKGKNQMKPNEKALKILENTPIGQTKFQLKYFVIGDQAHLMHQIRQVALEIEVREASLNKMNYNAEKRKLKLTLKKEKLEKDKNRLSKTEIKLRKLNIKREEWKVQNQEKTLTGLKKEIGCLYDILEELTKDVNLDELLEKFDEFDEKYWVKRLAKQAAIDVATAGRITAGNLGAIELLPKELQTAALKETVRLFHESANNIQRELASCQFGQNSSQLGYDLKE